MCVKCVMCVLCIYCLSFVFCFVFHIILVIVCLFFLPPHGHCRDVAWGLTACDIRVSVYFSEALRSHKLTKVHPKHNLLPFRSKCDLTTTTCDDKSGKVQRPSTSEWMKWVTQAAFLPRHEAPPWVTASSEPPSLPALHFVKNKQNSWSSLGKRNQLKQYHGF